MIHHYHPPPPRQPNQWHQLDQRHCQAAPLSPCLRAMPVAAVFAWMMTPTDSTLPVDAEGPSSSSIAIALLDGKKSPSFPVPRLSIRN